MFFPQIKAHTGLRSRGSHFRITPRDGPFFQNFFVVPRYLGEFDGVI